AVQRHVRQRRHRRRQEGRQEGARRGRRQGQGPQGQADRRRRGRGREREREREGARPEAPQERRRGQPRLAQPAPQGGGLIMRLYVYGVTLAEEASVPAGLTGVGGESALVRLLPVGPVAAVVSPAPTLVRAKRRDVMAHQDVLAEI